VFYARNERFELFLFLIRLGAVFLPQVVDRKTDKIQGVPYFVGDSFRQLSDPREVLRSRSFSCGTLP
jgi:hypothetical protein